MRPFGAHDSARFKRSVSEFFFLHIDHLKRTFFIWALRGSFVT
jgi:hypothetical protein